MLVNLYTGDLNYERDCAAVVRYCAIIIKSAVFLYNLDWSKVYHCFFFDPCEKKMRCLKKGQLRE